MFQEEAAKKGQSVQGQDAKIEDIMNRLRETVRNSLDYFNINRMEFSGSRDQHNFCLALAYYLGNFGVIEELDHTGNMVQKEYIN